MVEYIEENGRLRCVFQGALDTVACDAMAAELYARVDKAALPVVFDLKGVDFLASAFFRICLVVGKKQGSEKLAIVNLSPLCKRMFKLAGLDRIFQLADA